jgi:uncharacterized protein (DUF2384 family)
MPRGRKRTAGGKRRLAPTRKKAASRRGRKASGGLLASNSSNLRLIAGPIAVDRVAATFGLSKVQLAETVGLKREAFYKSSRRRAPKTQGRLREMIEIVSRVCDWAGGNEQALAWYRAQPLPAFGGRTAESLVKSGQASVLRDYLDHLAMGGFA